MIARIKLAQMLDLTQLSPAQASSIQNLLEEVRLELIIAQSKVQVKDIRLSRLEKENQELKQQLNYLLKLLA